GLLFFVMPNGIGDAFNIEERIMMPWLMTFEAWLAIEVNKVPVRRNIALGVVVFLLLQMTDRTVAFAAVNARLKEFNEVGRCIPDNSAYISIDLDHAAAMPLSRSLKHPFATTTRFNPYVNFPGTLTAGREIAYVANYEAVKIRPYFQLKYQPWLDSMIGEDFDTMARSEDVDGVFRKFADGLDAAEHPVDYLMTSQFTDAFGDKPSIKATASVIAAHYVLECASQSGAVKVYRRSR
ncbi:MAG TPA: hypothetical protein VFR09_05555, partial [Alphaproteobacteria bacterium]|nr:hypothetical protein [Alphaproteobacteria bacterium]